MGKGIVVKFWVDAEAAVSAFEKALHDLSRCKRTRKVIPLGNVPVKVVRGKGQRHSKRRGKVPPKGSHFVWGMSRAKIQKAAKFWFTQSLKSSIPRRVDQYRVISSSFDPRTGEYKATLGVPLQRIYLELEVGP